MRAGISKVIQAIIATVFKTDNVVYFKCQKQVIFMKEAIFATKIRPLSYKPSGTF